MVSKETESLPKAPDGVVVGTPPSIQSCLGLESSQAISSRPPWVLGTHRNLGDLGEALGVRSRFAGSLSTRGRAERLGVVDLPFSRFLSILRNQGMCHVDSGSFNFVF
jgi:hypothetical protein